MPTNTPDQPDGPWHYDPLAAWCLVELLHNEGMSWSRAQRLALVIGLAGAPYKRRKRRRKNPDAD